MTRSFFRETILNRTLILVLAVAQFVILSCKREGKPPDAGARTKHDAHASAGNASPAEGDVLDKALSLTHREVSEKLGSHRFTSNTSYEAALRDRTVSLKEKAVITVSAKGSYRVRAENDHNRGRELIQVNGLIAHRTFSGPWTLEKDDGFGGRFREDTYRGWSVAFKMFKGHLTVTGPTAVDYEGRPAFEYRIALDEDAASSEVSAPPSSNHPPPLSATDDEKEEWRLKNLLEERRKGIKKYISARGKAVIDHRTGVCLRFEFTGRYEVVPPGSKDKTPRVVSISTKAKIDEIGKPHPMSLPDETKPPPRRRKVVHDRLKGLLDRPSPAKTEGTGGRR